MCGESINVLVSPDKINTGWPVETLRLSGECHKCRTKRGEPGARELYLRKVKVQTADFLARCNVPLIYRTACFDNCPDLPAELITDARAWAARPAGMLYLHGSVGCGKSWVGVGILHYVLTEGFSTMTTAHS